MTKRVGGRAVIIGAGPAGLTAAYALCKEGVESVVLEKDSCVGGLARTGNYKGFRFDIGGHRFFTKVKAVDDLWREVLPGEGEFLRRKRLSRIYYRKKFFHYPLRPASALAGLGPKDSLLTALSYLRARLHPHHPEETFEQWVTNRFGRRLYETFFKTYTEKVWGMRCDEIAADWAAQRIRGLSLASALKDALPGRRRRGGEVIKTLVEEFDYPSHGPGMMWERMAELVERTGCGSVRLNTGVRCVRWARGRVEAVEVESGGRVEEVRGEHFVSSMPLGELVQKLSPRPPAEVLRAARSLRYRDFITVVLVVNRREVFPDNWIYVHDPGVRLGRVQNFKNWSPAMVPDDAKTCLGLEYFCSEGDDLWRLSDHELVGLGARELASMKLIEAGEVSDGTAVRVKKAYPVYDAAYRPALGVLRQFFAGFENLHLIGRNGTHRYNNQDHSMLTAMLAARNVLGEDFDLWGVNDEDEYHEAGRPPSRGARVPAEYPLAELLSTQPRVPARVDTRDAAAASAESEA